MSIAVQIRSRWSNLRRRILAAILPIAIWYHLRMAEGLARLWFEHQFRGAIADARRYLPRVFHHVGRAKALAVMRQALTREVS